MVKVKAKFWITITRGGAGWFALKMWLGEDGLGKFEEPCPYQSGDSRYRTRAEAEREAKDWAEAEELEYRP